MIFPLLIIAHDAALVERHHALFNRINDSLVMRREKNGGAEVVHFLQDLNDIVCVHRVKVPCRLVGDKHIGLIDDGAGLDALHLAAMDFLQKQGQVIDLASYDDCLISAARALRFSIYRM